MSTFVFILLKGTPVQFKLVYDMIVLSDSPSTGVPDTFYVT